MKYLLAIISLFIFFNFASFAQTKDDKAKKEELIYSQKIAFITERLQITPNEAQKFWPLYNEYWKRKNKLIVERNNIMNKAKNELDQLNEQECKELANEYNAIRLKETKLFNEYNEKFQTVLPPKKVLQLYISDSEFKSYLLKQLKKSK